MTSRSVLVRNTKGLKDKGIAMYLLSAVTLATLMASAICMPTGPPDAACATMVPNHDPFPPRTGDSGYTVSVTRSGHEYTVRIDPKSGVLPSIRGVFIQARRNGITPVGEWTILNASEQLLKIKECPGGPNNGVSHSASVPREFVEAVWDSRGVDNLDEVTVRASLVENYSTYWVNQTAALPW